jgi:hypothetical protein
LIVFLHILRILSAYLAATVVTCLAVSVLLVLFMNGEAITTDLDITGEPGTGLTLELMITVFLFVVILSAPLAVLFTTLAEWMEWRSWKPYVGFSTTVGLFLSLGFGMPWPVIAGGVVTGVMAGLIYWFIAGRFSGLTNKVESQILLGVLLLLAVPTILFWSATMFGITRFP